MIFVRIDKTFCCFVWPWFRNGLLCVFYFYTDMTFTHEGNKTFTDNLVNFEKMVCMTYLKENFKRPPYSPFQECTSQQWLPGLEKMKAGPRPGKSILHCTQSLGPLCFWKASQRWRINCPLSHAQPKCFLGEAASGTGSRAVRDTF